ncbi:MAG: Abi family protein [Alistipes sp.]|nr:Abi family protein [Alistipes sp.]
MTKPFLSYQQQLSKMYSFLPTQIRKKVSKNFYHVTDRELEQYLKVLVLYRNVCAHNERLFSHIVYSEIPDTILHKKLGIFKNGSQYVCGKKDLFSVIIAFRYLLSKKDFMIFKGELTRIIKNYLKKSKRLSEKALLNEMGFPEAWKKITRYRI